MDKIPLVFRRGGGWVKEKGKWYATRDVGAAGVEGFVLGNGNESVPECEYAELPAFEIVEPDPEPLKIEGCENLDGRVAGVWRYGAVSSVLGNFLCLGSGPTRRDAILAYNAAARVMGAKE